MTPLWKLARLIRSKNAGPFQLTFDVMFEDEAIYRHVRDSGVLSRERFAALYNTPSEAVHLVHYDAGLAIKATIPRPTPSGDLGDTDIFGGQQYAPLVDLEIDVPADNGAAALDDGASSAADIVARVQGERGFRRRWHTMLARYEPEALADYHRSYTRILELPALPASTKELLIIAIDACQFWPGIKGHMRNALRAGLTEEEIAEAVITAGIPGGVHAMAYGLEALDDVLTSGLASDPMPEL
jgi:AhpD family alkylhydroperoxidase